MAPPIPIIAGRGAFFVVDGMAVAAAVPSVAVTSGVLFPVTIVAVPVAVDVKETMPGTGQVLPVLLQSVGLGTTVNFAEVVALRVIALTVTRYSSGANVEASTGNDQVLSPDNPG